MRGERDSYQLEKRYFRKDGELIWVEVTAVLERDEDGAPRSAISMIENITERKAAEEELRRQSAINEHQALHDALTGLAEPHALPRPDPAGDQDRAAATAVASPC